MSTQKFILSFLALLPVVWTVAWHDVCFFSVAFPFFSSFVMHIRTSLFCMYLDPAAGLLNIWAFCFGFYFGAGVGSAGWFSFSCFVVVVVLFISLNYFFGVLIIRRPSSKQGLSRSSRFCLILCRMNFWWLENSEFSSSSSLSFFYAIWLLKNPPPPPPPFSIQHREMNGNKIFSCHHPFFGLVQATPFCLKKVVCERMTPFLPSWA